MKLRDLEDVSSIFVTHEMNNLTYLCSEYAVVNESGDVVFEREGERLCLINSNDDDATREHNLQRYR